MPIGKITIQRFLGIRKKRTVKNKISKKEKFYSYEIEFYTFKQCSLQTNILNTLSGNLKMNKNELCKKINISL